MAIYDGIMSFWKDRKKNKIYEIVDAQAREDLQDKADASSLAAVATSGDYDDLTNTPTIPAAQVNSDWNASSGVAKILNKPTIPAAQVNSDWNAVSGVAEILNKPSLATVATSGSYYDLTDQPTIPTSDDYVAKSNGHVIMTLDVDSRPGAVSRVAVHGNGSEDATVITNHPNVGVFGMRMDGNGYKEIYAENSNYDTDVLLSIDDNRVLGGILGSKQDALTAGTNISITNNTISATDTIPDNWYANDSFSDVTGLASGGTWSSLATFNIPYAGTWLISVAVQYPSNATGSRSAGIYTGSSSSPTDVSGIRFQQTVRAADGAATNIVLTIPTTIAANNRTVHIMGRQTSGSSMGTTTNPIRIRASALRLSPATS